MSSSLAIKVIASFAGIGTSAAGVYFVSSMISSNNNIIDTTKGSSAIVVSTGAAIVQSSSSSVKSSSDELIEYKCKVSGTSESENCIIKEFDVTSSGKNKEILSAIKNNSSNTKITTSTIKEEHKVFKIFASSTFADSFSSDTNKKIEILDKNNKNLASLNFLFGIKTENSSDTFIGNTKTFLGRAKTFTVASGGAAQTTKTKGTDVFKCSIDGADSTANLQNCKIIAFSTSDNGNSDSASHTALTYNHTTDDATTIEQYKHYIIEYTNSGSNISIETSKAWTNLYANVYSSGGSSPVSSGVTKIQFDLISPVVITSEANKRALIVKGS